MSFRKNDSQQISMFDSFNSLTFREQKALERSWAKTFADEVFPMIDEERFSVLYSDKASRPNTPVNVIIGALVLKELFDLSDDEVVEDLLLDPRFQYALHTTSFDEQPLSDKSLTRFRQRCYDYEQLHGIDLYHDCVTDLGKLSAKLIKIDGRIRRMDSLMVESNIRKLSRMELIYRCISRFVMYLHKNNHDPLLKGLEHYYDPDDFNRVIYHSRSTETDGRMAVLLRDADILQRLCSDRFDDVTEYQLLVRCLSEQTIEEGGVRRLRTKADGQMGCIMKVYREWQLSGDRQFLEAYWPRVKKALGYAWREKGWDGNQDGIMEGDQHNTMDVSYFGPNPQMGFWYIGALRAAEKMATAMKEREFAKKCKALADNGSKWMDENLFNGEYYEHRITDPATFEYLDMSDPDVKVPDYQLGRGCLVDQLVGQYMAHICGLGYLGDEAHIKKTLESIMKYNFMENVSYHFNNMRSYVLGDEAALLMAAWPHGRLKVPFPYFPEAMTGFEYCAAVGMLYEGQTENGLKCIKAIRDRFDGAKRNPFNEPECGFHYARSMASWAAIIALSRFNYSAVDRTISFTSEPGRYFWSTGYAYGTCEITDKNITIKVIDGRIWFDRIKLQGKKDIKAKVSLGSIFGSYSHDI